VFECGEVVKLGFELEEKLEELKRRGLYMRTRNCHDSCYGINLEKLPPIKVRAIRTPDGKRFFYDGSRGDRTVTLRGLRNFLYTTTKEDVGLMAYYEREYMREVCRDKHSSIDRFKKSLGPVSHYWSSQASWGLYAALIMRYDVIRGEIPRYHSWSTFLEDAKAHFGLMRHNYHGADASIGAKAGDNN